ncbi:CoA transferase [Sphingobacterium hungaricum]
MRALGLGHVIAGASIGRALALHGADVLNVNKPNDWEHNMFIYTSYVGMRSAVLDFTKGQGKTKMEELLKSTDVFFSNRRPGYLDRHGLDAETLCKKHPGLIHVKVVLTGEDDEWSQRAGFDVSTGTFAGPYALESEGLDEPRTTPDIQIINDYIGGWVATTGVLQALKRRAVEGGSYRVVVSLTRVTLELMRLGIFEKGYTQNLAGSSEEYTYVEPELFTAETPLGTYSGLTEQVEMTKTPGEYKHVLVPRGSSKPEWES